MKKKGEEKGKRERKKKEKQGGNGKRKEKEKGKDKWKGKGKRGRKRERENVESDSNDDSESQSIDINAITIDNNASDDVASRTRSKMTIKARNERARLDKAQKRSQNIPSRSLKSAGFSSEVTSIEY